MADPAVLAATARAIVEAEFPPTLVPDVLTAAGLDPDMILGSSAAVAQPMTDGEVRRRSSGWPARVLSAWNRQCAFCGYDGQLGNVTVGVEVAHVRWFNFDGPDDLDNGLALCSFDDKLFNRGVLGLTVTYAITVSDVFTARTPVGRRVYDLAGREITPRPGTSLPAARHVHWHTAQVFDGMPLAA